MNEELECSLLMHCNEKLENEDNGLTLTSIVSFKTSLKLKFCLSRAQDDFNHVIIANYEEKQKELLTENEELRNSLTELQNELVEVEVSASQKQRKYIRVLGQRPEQRQQVW